VKLRADFPLTLQREAGVENPKADRALFRHAPVFNRTLGRHVLAGAMIGLQIFG